MPALTMHARLVGYGSPLYLDHAPSEAEVQAWLEKVTGETMVEWSSRARTDLLHGSHPGIYCSRAALPIVAGLLGVSVELASSEVLFISERFA